MVMIRIGVPQIKYRLLPRFPITPRTKFDLFLQLLHYFRLSCSSHSTPLCGPSLYIYSVQPQISIIKFRFGIRFLCLFPILLLIDGLIIMIPATTVKSVFHTRCSGLKFKGSSSVTIFTIVALDFDIMRKLRQIEARKAAGGRRRRKIKSKVS